MRYQVDENISTLKLYIDIFALHRHNFAIYMQKMQNCKQVIGTRVAKHARTKLKFCLPKESISEQLESGYIDTGQKKES